MIIIIIIIIIMIVIIIFIIIITMIIIIIIIIIYDATLSWIEASAPAGRRTGSYFIMLYNVYN